MYTQKRKLFIVKETKEVHNKWSDTMMSDNRDSNSICNE